MPSPLPILFEDEVLVAVAKPARMPVHGRPGARLPDLLSTVEAQLGRRLVLFHRLDIDTTGVVLLGKSRSINAAVAAMFAEKRVRKAYWAVVRGRWSPQWTRIETRIDRDEEGKRFRNVVVGGREALSTCRILAAGDEKSWIEVLPKTGRTHQVRLHCLAMGCPVLGDRTYGEAGPAPIALHAWRLDFRHPVSGALVRLRAVPPAYWPSVWLAGLDFEAGFARALAP
jgi:RluA family pseudouridine synthase